ncbi:MAG: UDP-N-acetylglucosamine 2-epimerase, partial [Anaerolineae bacterium]|nr:UDP-N-acetylglucosamine 2-epimerase [Anaerolineae bacterium]
HAVQTAEVMQRFEPIILAERPDWLLVYGDVNSTVATALVATKLQIPVAHVEAGLRSFDRRMPEEINRLLTDQIASLLLTPSADGNENLRREGVAEEKIHLVGNVMIDTLLRLLPQAEAQWPGLRTQYGLTEYGLVTLHRPSNVDDAEMLPRLLHTLDTIGERLPLFFPVHPRTRKRMADLGLEVDNNR